MIIVVEFGADICVSLNRAVPNRRFFFLYLRLIQLENTMYNTAK